MKNLTRLAPALFFALSAVLCAEVPSNQPDRLEPTRASDISDYKRFSVDSQSRGEGAVARCAHRNTETAQI